MRARILLCLVCLLCFGCAAKAEKHFSGIVLNSFQRNGDEFHSRTCGFRVRLNESLEYIHFYSNQYSEGEKYYACTFLKEHDEIQIIQDDDTYKWKTGTKSFSFQ